MGLQAHFKVFSYGDFLDSRLCIQGIDGLYVNRQASLDGFVDILQELLKCFSLGSTAGDGRYFSPKSAFLRFVDNHFDFQKIP